MSKKGDKKKLDKTTRHVLEAFSDVIKQDDNGEFKLKAKGRSKKQLKKLKRSCMHWRIVKNKIVPMVEESAEHPGYWHCKGCGEYFPIRPLTDNEYSDLIEKFLSIVNQMCIFSVRMGGDSDDTKMLIEFKHMIPKFEKVAENILAQLNKREQMQSQSESYGRETPFDDYNTFGYR